MSDKIVIGSIVRLKSGGPAMVAVTEPEPGRHDGVSCIWFTGPESCQISNGQVFDYRALEIVT